LLHLADLHVRDKDIEEACRCLDYVIGTAKERAIDLIVVAGDLFDSRDIKLDSKSAKLVIEKVSTLADIAPVAIITGTPTHDGKAPEILRFAKGRHWIHVATEPEQIRKPDFVLTLVPTPTKQFVNNGSIVDSNESLSGAMNTVFADFGAQAAGYDGTVPHILVGHWDVSGARLPAGQIPAGQDIVISVDQMMLADPDLVCLGHIHQKQMLGGRAFFSGSLYPLNWGELTDHGFYIHTLDGRKVVSSEFIESPCRKLLKYTLDLTNDGQIQMPTENILGADVRVDVKVWQDKATTIDRDNLRADLVRLGAASVDDRLIRIPRQTVRCESVLKVERLRDKLVAMAAFKGETVPESILLKADELETELADELIGRAV